MSKASVAVLDDDENLRFVVKSYLESDGYSVFDASTGKNFFSIIENHKIDLILLDLGLGNEDGLGLLPLIKQKTSAPVIIVSGKDGTTDRVVGLEMGADDYITKPFEMRELSARVKANIRRTQAMVTAPVQGVSSTQTQISKDEVSTDNLRIGEWVFDKARLQLIHDDGAIEDLTKNEYDLLSTFVARPNRAISRDYLYEALKEDDYNSFDRAIDVQVTRLRKKLRDDPKKPRYIKTVRGVGYMFIGAT
ncbi:MAG: DNA-binding response regulator [Micavibrio sp.]|nr:DNA-binding response regulator [Micavibrio sp.]|tara:strand:- start:2906 stop:3652 length:747 start_codon:yes stop_codon:yes gene_type:complete